MSTRRGKRIDWREAALLAENMRAKAYAPYSGYRVGAVLVARKDSESQTELFIGANVENASYGLCVCAERNAVASAVLAGMTVFLGLVVATEGPTPAAPCGMCRQVLAEFATDMPIGLVVGGEIVDKTSLAQLLPRMFNGAALAEAQAKIAKQAKRASARKARS
ncbi:MAG: cytidine deaminase [Deltaproteobacteria bacterium]|nr:cytidine deaminase [Deltaproteobacteria bacterium]